MKRTNTIAVSFANDDITKLADGCATLWNKLNYRRRQSFFSEIEDFDWSSQQEYESFTGWLGSATTQQIIRKNDAAWRSFFALKKKEANGTLPKTIQRVNPPGYWKDRKTGKKKGTILIRNDCYHVIGRKLKLPKGLVGKIKGNLRWSGKQGGLEIQYDELSKKWYAHQPVEAVPFSQPSGNHRAFVDIGVRYPIAAVFDDDDSEPIAYSGSELLSDWWYWTDRISRCQTKLKRVNDRFTSLKLKKLYRTRRRRFQHGVNAIVRDFVEFCRLRGVEEVVAGDLTGIRDGNVHRIPKVNSMIHNFWSHDYLLGRLRLTLENYGLRLTLLSEAGTSSRCPRCGSTDFERRGRLFHCRSCGLEAHRDVVGSYNIRHVYRDLMGIGRDVVNRVMAHPRVRRLGSILDPLPTPEIGPPGL